MKKRRTLVISALLVAALALGIGYAALSQDVKITGDIASSAVIFDVQFTKSDMEVYAVTDGYETEIARLSSKGTIGSPMIHLKAAGLKEAGDKVTYTLELTNKSDIDVTLTALQLVDSDTSDVIDLTDTAALNEHFAPFTFKVTGCSAAQELAPNGTTTITIEISLAEPSKVAATHAYTLKAVAEPTNNELE